VKKFSLTQYAKRQGRIETIGEMLDNEMQKVNIKRWQKIDVNVQNGMKGMGERHLKGCFK
jgi:hypothetical protein